MVGGGGWARREGEVYADITRPGLSRSEQLEAAQSGMNRRERADVATLLDRSGLAMSPGARNFLEALLGRAPLSAEGPLSVDGDQKDGIRGRARPGDQVEAINLSTAPSGRLHLTDTVVIGEAGPDGRFVGRLPDLREGDIVRLRARGPGRTPTDWLTVRAWGLERADTRNAVVNLERMDLVLREGGIAVAHNTARPLSEPGAIVRFENARTGKTKEVTVTEAGSLPEGLTLDGRPGDRFRVAVSDGANNRDFREVAGTLVAPGQTAGGGARDLPDPLPTKGNQGPDGEAKVPKARFEGPLFSDGPSAADVRQGAIGNCYFPAALAAIAHARPDAILEAIEPVGDDVYRVRFFENGSRRRPVEVEVDADLYVRSFGGPIYGSTPSGATRSGMELWYPLMEKAYAQWKGGYEAIGNGGIAGRVISEVLGGSYDYERVNPGNAHAIYRIASAAAEAGRPMAAGTHGTEQAEMYANSGIYANHAYSVLGVEEEGGKRFLQLRNPWAQGEPGNDGKNDGFFRLKLEDFVKYFSSLHVARV